MKSLSLSQPHLLITVGIPGSGKSFFAEKFAATFQSPFIDYSLLMEIAGQNSAVSDAYAGHMLKELFKTKQTIVFDGPAATRAERTALQDLAASAGYRCLFVWVQTDTETAKARFIKAAKKTGRRITPRQYDALVKEFTAPIAKEHPNVVVSGKHTFATQVKAVLKSLALIKQTTREEKARGQRVTVTIGKRKTIQ